MKTKKYLQKYNGSINQNKLNAHLNYVEIFIKAYSSSEKLYFKPIHVDAH